MYEGTILLLVRRADASNGADGTLLSPPALYLPASWLHEDCYFGPTIRHQTTMGSLFPTIIRAAGALLRRAPTIAR